MTDEADLKAKCNDMKCCWHKTQYVLLTNPPTEVEQCCFCGETKKARRVGEDDKNHGPFAPQNLHKIMRDGKE